MQKELYVAPTAQIVDLKMETVICQSLTDLSDYPGGKNPFNL